MADDDRPVMGEQEQRPGEPTEAVEFGRRFEDGEVIPSPEGYVDDPRWLTCAQKPVRWVQRTVAVDRTPWVPLAADPGEVR